LTDILKPELKPGMVLVRLAAFGFEQSISMRPSWHEPGWTPKEFAYTKYRMIIALEGLAEMRLAGCTPKRNGLARFRSQD
jgi:hypothetical protein